MTNSTDERLKKELGVGRQSREMEDRQVTENREVTEDDRLEMFRAQLFNDALPDLPDMPGYHVCWLTTTNPRDPIHRRIQLGYEPIKASDVPGMEFASVKTGEYAGLIGVNEMLAFKLPETLYQGLCRKLTTTLRYVRRTSWLRPQRSCGDRRRVPVARCSKATV
jgi:hypothetical protein